MNVAGIWDGTNCLGTSVIGQRNLGILTCGIGVITLVLTNRLRSIISPPIGVSVDLETNMFHIEPAVEFRVTYFLWVDQKFPSREHVALYAKFI